MAKSSAAKPPVNKLAVALAVRDAMRVWRKGKSIVFQPRSSPWTEHASIDGSPPVSGGPVQPNQRDGSIPLRRGRSLL